MYKFSTKLVKIIFLFLYKKIRAIDIKYKIIFIFV
jgi:hypothetical protein